MVGLQAWLLETSAGILKTSIQIKGELLHHHWPSSYSTLRVIINFKMDTAIIMHANTLTKNYGFYIASVVSSVRFNWIPQHCSTCACLSAGNR